MSKKLILLILIGIGLITVILFSRSIIKTKPEILIVIPIITPSITLSETPIPTLTITPTIIPTSTPTPTPRKMILIPLVLDYSVNCYEDKAEEVRKANTNLIESEYKYNSCISGFVSNTSDCDLKCENDNSGCWQKCWDAENWSNCTDSCSNNYGQCIGSCIAEGRKQKSEHESNCSNSIIQLSYNELVKLIGEYCQK